MADPKRFLDVWIVEANTVYKEVPYTVIADWIQQGRLLEDDQARPSGTKDWKRIADVPGLAAFLPRAEPLRASDQAEALESVELDFAYKKQPHDEDDDVDMIPLIDVSLVLLIFFMLTASTAGGGAFVPMPETENAVIANTTGIQINVNLEGEDPKKRSVVYSLGEEGKPTGDKKDQNLTSREEMLGRFDELLKKKTAPVDVTIKHHKECKFGLIVDLTMELSKPDRKNKINQPLHTGVTEKMK